MEVTEEAMARFWARVALTPDGCLAWTGALNTHGYGRFGHQGVRGPAHRFAYEALVGDIAPGLQIDHLCRNRGCVRPDHLEAVTQRENILRGTSPIADQARRTRCPREHDLTPANTIVKHGKRECRRCHNQRRRERRAERNAA